MRRLTIGLFTLAIVGCKQKTTTVVYQTVPVETRDIVVSAEASGRVVPDTVVEVKTRASGPVIDIKVETGQQVKRGQLLLTIDPRLLQNSYDQAAAQLEVAKVNLETAETQFHRADTLLATQTLTKQDFEAFRLNYYSAKAALVSAQISVDNAKINLDEADVRAPISGTIIEKSVERGTQVASATSNVGGGTSLMKMADLSLIQAQTLVDETDIGKVKPGMQASVTVDAYPSRPFRGSVLKIEPNDTTVQNVTMFPVRVRIENRDGLLLPGMNAEVEINIGRKDQVLAVPVSALRTPRDLASAAQVLGLDIEQVRQQLASTEPTGEPQQTVSLGGAARRPDDSPKDTTTTPSKAGPAGNTMTTPDGRTLTLPPGVTEDQVRTLFHKRFSGGTLTAAEEATLAKVRQGMQRGDGAGRSRAGGGEGQSSYIVFVKRHGQPTPQYIRTGLSDLDYSEVVSGLQAGDSVYLLPSAGLVQSQQDSRNRVQAITGGGLGGMKSQQTTPASGSQAAPSPAPPGSNRP